MQRHPRTRIRKRDSDESRWHRPSFTHLKPPSRQPHALREEDDGSRPIAVEDLAERELVRCPAPKRRRGLDRYGWYEPRLEGAWTTTRQAEAWNLATSRRRSRQDGVLAGLNTISQELEIVDAFAAYGSETSGINVVVIGDIGRGKSSWIKTVCVLRQLVANRQVVILDKKPQAGVGEYTPLAQMLGAESIRFRVGGNGACLNLLDPAISARGDHRGGIDGVVPAG